MRNNRFRAVVIALLAILTALGGATVASASGTTQDIACERGEVCLWTDPEFRGTTYRHTLTDTTVGECVHLPVAVDIRSFVNLMSRHVTVYQSRECATEGEFDTYPGGGTYVPAAPYVVRGFQVWD
ncbi:peptidase inhibitor family I36 protein [Actinokineospora bangkokensis]|uniref:Proteinase inhibitor I36 SMPI n=1 Tax=Actinokineospora bangkokensis TaxID=1193682 RepID=A0A1Q9LDL9_9PSEU|nr:peptidase inhibitor family I36 protein [Actinokineospora bangkokensis]OLR90130.1 hypothetical protein BJP25_03920 [Actinokineospora bangkokensis]